MRPAALVFLRDNPAAQRLAAAWPHVTRRDAAPLALAAEIAALANVARSVAAKTLPVLRAAAICRDDGTLDPLAEQYIAAQVNTTIRSARR